MSRGNNASIDKGFKDYQPSSISLYVCRQWLIKLFSSLQKTRFLRSMLNQIKGQRLKIIIGAWQATKNKLLLAKLNYRIRNADTGSY